MGTGVWHQFQNHVACSALQIQRLLHRDGCSCKLLLGALDAMARVERIHLAANTFVCNLCGVLELPGDVVQPGDTVILALPGDLQLVAQVPVGGAVKDHTLADPLAVRLPCIGIAITRLQRVGAGLRVLNGTGNGWIVRVAEVAPTSLLVSNHVARSHRGLGV